MKALALSLIFFCTSALSADIFFFRGAPERLVGHEGIIPDSWLPRIILEGPITPGDEVRFKNALDKAAKSDTDWEKHRTLLLNSEGGDVSAAMAIGKLARQAQVITAVHERSVCASACILVLAGGVWRYARDDAKLGLHRPYFADPRQATAGGYSNFQKTYDAVIEAHRRYFVEMKVGTGLLERMIQIPSSEVQWIGHAEASRLNLLGEDASYAEWKRAKRIARDGAACVDWEDNRYFPCVLHSGFKDYERCAATTNKPSQCK